MFFKAPSLCALALYGVAYVAAQSISPGRYTISPADVLNPAVDALVRNQGSGQTLVLPGGAQIPVVSGSDQWDVAAGQRGGVTIQNVAFGTFLKVDANNAGTPVTTAESQDEATSFEITAVGQNQVHVSVVGQNLLWSVSTFEPPVFPPLDGEISIQPLAASGSTEEVQVWQFRVIEA
ncbi:hypothetical protein BD779DRAFT_1119831 [Infundibulicybe gibba]|nr:hypothetical protein BD779DRAFT_1119831 [Infundibulicybe gibba]